MSNAVTSSAALTELKTDLTHLSQTLHEIFDLMNTDMSQVGDAWQDGKYQEFVEGYRPQINKCEEISQRYSEWCARVLDPTIDNVMAVEKTDVGGGGSSAIGGGGSAVGGGMAAASTAARAASKASGFNMGGQRTPGEKIVDALRKEDSKNTCYTSDQKEGRWRPGPKRTVTTTETDSNGSSHNSGSMSQTSSTGTAVGANASASLTGVSIGANTSASTNNSQTYNSGSSSRTSSQSTSKTISTEEICVEKDKLPMYKDIRLGSDKESNT